MGRGIFITGTDTGVGKTVVTGLFAGYCLEKGLRTVTQKWVETGVSGRSEDIRAHLDLMKVSDTDYSRYLGDMCPYLFKHPASPHLASGLEKVCIDEQLIINSFKKLRETFEMVIVEGAGGALVPLREELLIIDVCEKVELPVLIVAENKLGAINHTLLTIETLKKRKLDILGVIFNRAKETSDTVVLDDNPKIVEKISGVSVLADLPFMSDAAKLYPPIRKAGERVLTALDTFI